MPLCLLLLKRVDKVAALVIFLIICDGTEILFSFVCLPKHIYRLLAARYILLFYLGWIWVNEGVRINWATIVLSAVSLCCILFFEYSTVDKEPWFINAGFRFHRWPCYFFVAYGFTALLYVLWMKISHVVFIVRLVRILAAASYEIFLMQMTVIIPISQNNASFYRKWSIKAFCVVDYSLVCIHHWWDTIKQVAKS